MHRVENQALREITGAYHGASHQKLGHIAAVEPLQSRLDHIFILWAARSLRTGTNRPDITLACYRFLGACLCVRRFESCTPQKDFLTAKEHGFVLKRFPLLS